EVDVPLGRQRYEPEQTHPGECGRNGKVREMDEFCDLGDFSQGDVGFLSSDYRNGNNRGLGSQRHPDKTTSAKPGQAVPLFVQLPYTFISLRIDCNQLVLLQ